MFSIYHGTRVEDLVFVLNRFEKNVIIFYYMFVKKKITKETCLKYGSNSKFGSVF